MTFADMIQKQQSITYTENGALAYNTTCDPLVDLFAVCGAMRRRSDEDITLHFSKAMIEDKQLATRLAFYTRDVRGGLGERRTGRLMFRHLAVNYPDIFAKNIGYIAEFGRWDDLVYLLYDAPDLIVPLIGRQLKQDIESKNRGESISLLAKWLPSVNTSNRDTVQKGRYLAAKLGMSERQYRKTLSGLRAYLKVVEVDLSAKRYSDIVYQAVPSKAMTKYREAFRRNDGDRFREYLSKVQKGEAKINSSVLYPYDIVERYLYNDPYKDVVSVHDDPVLEEQWRALPNYVQGDERFLVMADVSGSMYGRPMATSIGLAIYFAEHNKGPFANKFMTFSSRPELVTIKGASLRERIAGVYNADWMMNTDLEAAFRLVLDTAVKNKVPQDELPTSIVVITDMEFDSCTSLDQGFYEQMSALFEANGYHIPNIVFWNVNSHKDTFHASYDLKGVQLASGQSATVFKTLVNDSCPTPYEYMLSVLNDERYQMITV